MTDKDKPTGPMRRPMIGLTDAQIAFARKLGGGKVSRGVRICVNDRMEAEERGKMVEPQKEGGEE